MYAQGQKAFTLVEIMIVVSIVALLASIAIPGLLRAYKESNDALAKNTLRTISVAAETYFTAHNSYPINEDALTQSDPPYLTDSYCDKEIMGFFYTCNWGDGKFYTITATPVRPGISGSKVLSISTGGIINW